MTPVFLLVEPSPILSSVLSKWLETVLTNPRLFIVSNGDEALQLAIQEVPSHVLIEIDLPDKKGIEILHQLRQALPSARIIATSWYESFWFSNRVREAGADVFLLKDRLASELLRSWEITTE